MQADDVQLGIRIGRAETMASIALSRADALWGIVMDLNPKKRGAASLPVWAHWAAMAAIIAPSLFGIVSPERALAVIKVWRAAFP